MKSGFKRISAVLITALMLVVGLLPGSVWAENGGQEEKIATSAPLNPAFVEYVNNLEAGTIAGLSENGYRLGHIPSPVARYEGTESSDMVTSATLPAAYDLRTTGQVTAIRDQNPYGSCWAFGSYASLESYLKRTVTIDLSENNLMRNHGFDWGPDDGGRADMAIAYLARWSGPVSESSDPYGTPKKTGLSSLYHVQEVAFLPQSNTVIKQAIIDGGAVDTSMYASALESDTYYNSSTAALYYDGNARVNHDVAIVGWDDNYDKSNFNNTPPSNGAWIIRNSWGTDWGDQGYFYMSYFDTYAGNEVTAFHNAEAINNYSHSYQYDPLGQTSVTGYSDNTAWGANIFTASAAENLTAVSTYTLSPNASLLIYVYTDVSSEDPTSGVLKSTKTVTVPLSGYHTIALDSSVALTAGQRFSVVVNYTTPGYNYPIPTEKPIQNYSSAATSNAGESFMGFDGETSWQDISQSDNTNVCIKAFTQAQTAAVLQSIAITSPANKLSYQIGEALDISGLAVTGTYSDGTTKAETIAAANISGFNSATATANQLLTINISGKTTTYRVQIVSSEEPGTGEFVGFLGQDPAGHYYLYNKVDFNNSYVAYQFNQNLAAANMYKHYLNNQCRIVALEENTKGYMDYNAAATASLLAQMQGKPFDINAYFGHSDAKLYQESVTDVEIVDKNGNIQVP